MATNLVPAARKINGKALTGDITLTAEDVGAVAQESWKTVEWAFDVPVSAVRLDLPSVEIKKGRLTLSLFSETEGTKLAVRIYADKEAASGYADYIMASTGNFFTNAQTVRSATVTWEPFGDGASRVVYCEAANTAANLKTAHTPIEFLYVVSMTSGVSFTGTAVLEYCE